MCLHGFCGVSFYLSTQFKLMFGEMGTFRVFVLVAIYGTFRRKTHTLLCFVFALVLPGRLAL